MSILPMVLIYSKQSGFQGLEPSDFALWELWAYHCTIRPYGMCFVIYKLHNVPGKLTDFTQSLIGCPHAHLNPKPYISTFAGFDADSLQIIVRDSAQRLRLQTIKTFSAIPCLTTTY
ncbi:hypothetical protein VNO77_34278 [Canavalia gladiata]|uniref:Uncharacterized protein n=1 Tax=Canavalia gladiata TaxID=3824 RepID=A0AAN9PX40_CANGL